MKLLMSKYSLYLKKKLHILNEYEQNNCQRLHFVLLLQGCKIIKHLCSFFREVRAAFILPFDLHNNPVRRNVRRPGLRGWNLKNGKANISHEL